MSTHTSHSDSHTHGLADGFDAQNLRALIERTMLWMRDEAFPRSDNERQAMRVVEETLVRLRKIEALAAASEPEPEPQSIRHDLAEFAAHPERVFPAPQSLKAVE